MKKYVINPDNFEGYIKTTLNNEGKSFYTGLTVEEMSINDGVNYIVISEQELDLYLENYYKSLQNEWVEISENNYNEMLNCLPPMNWHNITAGVNVFCISETTTAHLHSHYLKLTKYGESKYYTSLRSVFITDEEILSQIENIKL